MVGSKKWLIQKLVPEEVYCHYKNLNLSGIAFATSSRPWGNRRDSENVKGTVLGGWEIGDMCFVVMKYLVESHVRLLRRLKINLMNFWNCTRRTPGKIECWQLGLCFFCCTKWKLKLRDRLKNKLVSRILRAYTIQNLPN